MSEYFEFFFLESVESTNDEIKNLSQNKKTSIALFSEEQTNGKGRSSNKWLSQKGDLTCSFLVCENFNLNDLGKINIMISVCILDALKKIFRNLEVKVKWPNDLYRNNKKVSGILIESLSKNKKINLSIGVGININIPAAYSIDQPHSNLSDNIDCGKLIYHFCRNIVVNLDLKNRDETITKFNTNLYGYKKQVEINDNGNTFTGELVGINRNGELMIRNDDKKICIDNINSTMRLL